MCDIYSLFSVCSYVCFAVLPAPGMDNQQRSRTVMKSLNPLYNEMFTFSVSNGRLPQSQLHCSVWDYDRITTDDFIGQVCLNLCEVDWTDREPHWYDLTDKVQTYFYSLRSSTHN